MRFFNYLLSEKTNLVSEIIGFTVVMGVMAFITLAIFVL